MRASEHGEIHRPRRIYRDFIQDLCQVFIAIDPEALGENGFGEAEKSIKDAIHNAKPVTEGATPRYPGEKIRGYREDAEKNGISVPADAWEKILAV